MKLALLAALLPLVAGSEPAHATSGIRRCATHHFHQPKEHQTQQLINLYGPAAVTASTKKVVPVYWHTITSSKGEGALNSSQIANQMKVLNQDYAAAGFAFKLMGSDSTANDDWFHNLSADKHENQGAMKAKLRKGGANTLNFYSVNLTSGDLGFSSMPDGYKDRPIQDGVVFHHSTLPGGPWGDQYSRGKTVVHETGHWMGLYHTFEAGNCTDPHGDFVSDTPPQKEPTDGCPAKKDSCPGGGADLIHNYMDYSWDSCMTGFTRGQIVRMHTLTNLYRGL
ncbi:hypothetical protein OC846_006517 [Tilletia horrida]|uniref:Peptidase M43 pregnancy-associated plasma-A domain-containing protein n=1 Tax=Tilletia horrida TaxID=155126 RepID=A0AAN6GKW0_9BASI|nr:hypothetical protein OC845_006514 [Tilletia horrida]KAK0543153.1 hypothetical protein OC846_006517 [Tilletia horrida]KAK0561019.1 hypothetical protein OC861_006027 [Tilletia horrida]